MAPYQRTQQSKESQLERDARIAQLIKGQELNQQALESNINRAQQEAARMGLKPGKYSINATQGGIGVNPENDDFMRMMLAQQGRLDTSAQEISKRIQQENIPEAVSSLKLAEKDLPREGEEFKSVGGIKSLAPDFSVGALESLGIMPKGAKAERAALEAAKLLPRQGLFGASLTAGEKEAAEKAFGAGPFTSPSDIQKNLQRLRGIPQSAMENIKAGYKPEAVKLYESRPGAVKTDALKDFLSGGQEIEVIKQKVQSGQVLSPQEFRKARNAGLM
jgi:hypothetical protein